ncbi:MAG: hypothetical protein HXX11_11405 [Desulfuromonadales bacterium]|nr:hypothetical protein [Desulfuromonadales bacterium]
MDDVHSSLNEARTEIHRRWNDAALKRSVEEMLGVHLWPEMKGQPRGVLWRCLPSPDNGFTFFVQASQWMGLKAFLPEYIEDMFVHFNAEKKSLGRLSLSMPDGTMVTCDIVDFHASQGKPMTEVVLKTGESLVGFHHRLLDRSGYPVMRRDLSDWWISLKPARNYYHYYLAHFIAHGVLFDVFEQEEDHRENVFLQEVVLPNIEKVEREFGKKPLIVRHYPPEQTEEENFYWFSYPPHVNTWLVQWAQENNLAFKKVRTIT